VVSFEVSGRALEHCCEGEPGYARGHSATSVEEGRERCEEAVVDDAIFEHVHWDVVTECDPIETVHHNAYTIGNRLYTQAYLFTSVHVHCILKFGCSPVSSSSISSSSSSSPLPTPSHLVLRPPSFPSTVLVTCTRPSSNNPPC